MSTKLNQATYEGMIAEDLKWLMEQPDTLERAHIEHIIKDSIACYYPPKYPDRMGGVLHGKETLE